MRLRKLIAAVVCCLIAFFPEASRADFTSTYDPALLNNDPDATAAAPSDLNFGRRYASPFVLSETHEAGETGLQLTFWGGVRLGGEQTLPQGGFTMPDPLLFRFRIYTMDSGGQPGTLLWDQFSTVGSSQEIYRENVYTGQWYTKSYHEYEVFLSGIPELQAGTTYFLEVADRDPQTAGPGSQHRAWDWLGSVNDFQEYFRSTPGVDMQSWIGSALIRSRAFSFSVSAVPEPTSALLLLIAVSGAGIRTRRNRRNSA